VLWVSKKTNHSLFVLGGGLVRVFLTKSRITPSGANKRTQRLSRYKEFQVPSLPDDVLSPLVKNMLDLDEYLDIEHLDAGTNTMVLNQPRPRTRVHDQNAESSIPQAEIESSAPYQPFHTDKRVGLYEFEVPQQQMDLTALMAATSLDETAAEPTRRRKKGAQQSLVQSGASTPAGSSDAWAFGQAMEATKLDLGVPQLLDDDSFNLPLDASRALPASAMERILQRTGDDDAQIVVTTRRRRGPAPTQDDDGFFEDDCEVLDFADQRV
jgi:hypothetical protein